MRAKLTRVTWLGCLLVVLSILSLNVVWGQFHPAVPVPFVKHKLDAGAYETAAVADVNKDGILDIIAGARWYEGPEWQPRFIRNITKWDIHFDSLSDIAFDVNQDGYPDILTSFFVEKRVSWFENPKGHWGKKAWREHRIAPTDGHIEFLFFVDLEQRGTPHALFPNIIPIPMLNMPIAPIIWFDYDYKNGAASWRRYEIAPSGNGHSMGFGDINGDGRIDVVVPTGWYEAPEDIRKGVWKPHLDFRIIPSPRKNAAGNIYVYDVDDDGDADILTGAGHDYGVYWWEQIPGNASTGNWEVHIIDETWSQSHSAALADMDGDGDLDFVTGKRFWGHGGADPGSLEPGIIVWYELQRGSSIAWIKRVIDYHVDMGVGMQFPVVDVDQDGDLDLVAAGKKGLVLYENLTRQLGQ